MSGKIAGHVKNPEAETAEIVAEGTRQSADLAIRDMRNAGGPALAGGKAPHRNAAGGLWPLAIKAGSLKPGVVEGFGAAGTLPAIRLRRQDPMLDGQDQATAGIKNLPDSMRGMAGGSKGWKARHARSRKRSDCRPDPAPA